MSVYFIAARELDRVKIGHSNNPERRCAMLQTGSPVRLTIEAVIPGGVEAEAALHARFAGEHLAGEWFRLSQSIESFIDRNEYVRASRLRSPSSIVSPASTVIDALGGTSEVSRLTEAPTSTVHSWRKIGIPASRLAHLRMIAEAQGKQLPAPRDEAAAA